MFNKKRIKKLERKIKALEEYLDLEFVDKAKAIDIYSAPMVQGYKIYPAFYKQIERCKTCNKPRKEKL